MANTNYSTSGSRTRTLIIIIASMLLVGVWVGIYSFSKKGNKSAITPKTSGIPSNIYVTPGSKSSEKYVELQQAANKSGTKKAEAQGKTFIPTLIGNKAVETKKEFQSELTNILKEKEKTKDVEKLSKQVAGLLSDLNKQGQDLNNLLRLIRELQNQGYKVDDLEQLLKKLIDDGYNADELTKLLAQLKNQGYQITDLEGTLKKLLQQGQDPELINKILEQLLKDKLKALENAIKKLQDGGYNSKDGNFLNKIDNPDFNKLIQQLANQGYQVDSLEHLLKQLMDKGYNIFDMPILLQQLKTDGYDTAKLEELINKEKNLGNDIKDLRALLDALSAKNKVNNAPTTEISTPKENTGKATLTNIFNKESKDKHNLSESEKKYEEIVQQQQAKIIAATEEQKNKEKLLKLTEEQQAKNKQNMLNSEAKKKELDLIVANMNTLADNLTMNTNKIPVQSFVQGELKDNNQSSNGLSDFNNVNNLNSNPNKAELKDRILKAGTILFAVLETAINSDESGPILARIVQPPLLNTSLLGTIQASNNKYAEGLVLSFTTANIPDRIRSYGISAIAIDPHTARTSLASNVDHHYMLRWGTIFAATFLKGYSKAVAQSGTTVDTTTAGGQTNTVTKQSPLNPKQQIYQGLGEVASAWGQGISELTNRPNTITINSGTSLGILLTADFTIPSTDEIPSEQSNGNIMQNQQNVTNNITSNNSNEEKTKNNTNINNSSNNKKE